MYTFKVTEGAIVYYYVEWSNFIEEHSSGLYTNTKSLTAGQYYYFYIRYETFLEANPTIKLYWTYTGQAETIVPSANTYYPQYVGSTPIKITASWATGYSDSVVGHSGTCYPVWGDGKE